MDREPAVARLLLRADQDMPAGAGPRLHVGQDRRRVIGDDLDHAPVPEPVARLVASPAQAYTSTAVPTPSLAYRFTIRARSPLAPREPVSSNAISSS